MKAIIHPSQLRGIIHAPASKSSMQRACAAAWIRNGETHLYNPGKSKDDLVALDIIQQLGADVETIPDAIRIISHREARNNKIHCGESGLSVRMFTPIAALFDIEFSITGSGSLLKRPMHFFDEVLPQLGVTIHSENGYLPLKVRGPLLPSDIEVDGSVSSQFLTGLIMAYVAAGAEDKTIVVRNLQSKPYIDLTLSVLKEFELPVPENHDYREFYFQKQVPKRPRSLVEYSIEADWSGGAFLLVAGAMAGPIFIRGLDLVSTQADRAVVDILVNANAGIAMEAKGISIHPGPMTAFEANATDCPDLFPPLAALASACEGRSVIKGVGRLYHKESNRAVSLRDEFAKMGVHIELNEDSMIITGTKAIQGNVVSSRGDHRIAMALALLALRATGETVIEDAGAVDKSYPGFFSDLGRLGADLTLQF